MPILSPYTNQWIIDFENIKNELQQVLNNVNCTIEHVGSTAIPNLDAKPIIDIDIIMNDIREFEIIKENLENIGYYHNGNQGIEEREVFKRKDTYTSPILDTIKHHLYVCPKNSKALERHILLRDFLRKNSWARNEYQQIKYNLAKQANNDRKKYAELKEKFANSFIDNIIEKAKHLNA